jgi:hypothetical protein
MRLIILFSLCTFLLHSCDNAFYNPFIKDTYKGDQDDTGTPEPTAGGTPEPTAEVTAEPTPGGSNETPETAEPITLIGGTANVNADNTEASNAVSLSGDGGCCVSNSTGGNDLFYSIGLTAGETITIIVTPISDWDPAIYLFTDSADPEGSCVAGTDEEMNGIPETIIYTVPLGGDGTYIIGVDSFFTLSMGKGPFDMDIVVD